jgi:hypothetical protein
MIAPAFVVWVAWGSGPNVYYFLKWDKMVY